MYISGLLYREFASTIFTRWGDWDDHPMTCNGQHSSELISGCSPGISLEIQQIYEGGTSQHS